MKKFTPFFLLLAFIGATHVSAQDFYLKVGLGYAFAAPGEKVDQSNNVLNGSVANGSGVAVYNIKSASFTSGMQGVVGYGCMFSKNIGVELNAGVNITSRNYTESLTGLTNSNGVMYNYTAERQAHPVILMPSLLLQTAGSKWKLYMRMGVALPVYTGIQLGETYTYQTGDIHQYSWTISNYFSLGFTGATGVKFNINDHLALWGEASMLYLNVSRKERDLNTAIIDGRNTPLSQFSVTAISYHKNGITDQNGNEQALSQPFSNLGATVGISYRLDKVAKAGITSAN